jgi:hypothetical protein
MTQRQTVEAHGVLRTDTDNTLRCATEGSLPLRTQSLRRILAELPVCLNSEQGLPERVPRHPLTPDRRDGRGV